VFHSVPIAIGTEAARDLQRADIAVDGIDHAGSSFELRAFLNNPDADAATEPTQDNGYAGSIYVYGYGNPPAALAEASETGAGPRLPMNRSIIATDAVRRAQAAGPTATVTLVVVPYDSPGPEVDMDSLDVAVLIDEQPGQNPG
jgi:tyrosinase